MRPAAKLATALACTLGVFAITSAARPRVDSTPDREVRRLRAHFDSVLSELRSADASNLTAPQRSARETLIARLESSSVAGRFPHNHVRPGELVPVFRDEHGTLCAMAFLIASTGRTDIVDDVARTNDLAYIPELARDARLSTWLDSVGFTVAEAARIQPSYPGGPCLCPRSPSPSRDYSPTNPAGVNRFALLSAGATLVNGAAMWVNLVPKDASRARVRWTSAIGTVTGGAQLVVGALALRYDDARLSWGIGNVAVGALSAGTALWRLHHAPSPSGSVATAGSQ